MSSGELIVKFQCKPAAVYQCCSLLKGEGKLVSRADDANDGQNRWFVTKLA